MAENEKRYYWLKLKEGFFKEKEIKKLRKIAGGDTYTIIYLKLMLLSLKDEGKLFYEGVEDTFCEELALEIDEEIDNVKFTLMFLQKTGLMEEINSTEAFLTRIPESVGSETRQAETMRKKRQREKALGDGNNVTTMLSGVTKCYTEIDKELKLNKEQNILLLGAETAPSPKTSNIPAVISINLNDGSEYPITQPDIDSWAELYPAVNILQELRKMKGWADANPTKRKTKTGIKRFINSWLAREQDKPHLQTESYKHSGNAASSNIFLDMLNEGRAQE